MKIVVLTNKNSIFGKKLINELMAKNIHVEAVLVVKQPLEYYVKLFNYVKKSVGFFDAVYFSIQKIISTKEKLSKWRNNKFVDNYEKMNIRIIYTNGTNSNQTVEYVKELKPDLLLLGQTGIIRKRLVQIPKLGTLNSHPGILPYYRGIDCGKWAIYNRDYKNVGCTVHWVDTGVDTGSIILREKYRIIDDEKLKTLETHLDNCAVRLLVKVIESIIEKKELEVIVQNTLEGRQYYKMTRKAEKIVRRILSDRVNQ
jgi:methionyl-tRNA formyltransferase